MRTVRKSPLVSVLQLLGVLFVLWLGYTEAWPWLKAKLDESSARGAAVRERSAGGGGGSAGTSDASRCVHAAQNASSTLAGALRTFRSPPYDQSAWGAVSLDVSDALGRADNACLCGHAACREAAQAAALLRELYDSADGMVRGNPTGTRNLGALRGRADDHLDRARDLLGG
jgi:hypothetical protein